MEPLEKPSFVIAVTDLRDLPATVLLSSYGVRWLLHSHHRSSKGPLPHFSAPQGPSSSLPLPASLKPATKLLLVKEVTTGCGHHTKEKCHLLESCRQGLVLCPTFLLLPFSLGTPTHSRSGPQFSLLPSRDLCGPAASVTASPTLTRPTVPTPLLNAGSFNCLLIWPQQIQIRHPYSCTQSQCLGS